jgi:basic membrane lipoprotein Med (substrate-binding protein (PBP1-ABC) superfamily)
MKTSVLIAIMIIIAIITGVIGYYIGLISAPTPTITPTTPTTSPTPTLTPQVWTPPEKIKAAWIYVGPVGDFGWSYMHDIGRKYVQELFKDWLETTYVESVSEEKLIETIDRLEQKAITSYSLRHSSSWIRLLKPLRNTLISYFSIVQAIRERLMLVHISQIYMKFTTSTD